MENPQPFTVSRTTIFKTILLNPTSGWPIWVALAVGITLTCIGCFNDVRWLILGLIICLSVIPSMLFYIFIKYMFATEMVANLLNHTLERRQDGYLLHIFRPADQNDPIEKGKTWIESGRLTLFDANVIGRKTTYEYEVIFYKDAPLSILYVPR